ncbi:DTW domain-domain-containing protein [Syncephalastrum racemosum]|uniref:tRNA-uridine aminocarboxypropyltransferase 1 n=1 Tax=Syncephalastrum racemosum TaxID=13706 RepID=A0A1X2H8G1_SYNRA|nr:DTW domain-domain-containing protein [Syncephalastrum racemosum]
MASPAEKAPAAIQKDNVEGSTILPYKRESSSQTDEEDAKRSRIVSPFDDLNIDDDTILHKVTTRNLCPQCNKMMKYFCYRCFCTVGMDRSEIPFIKLPVHLDVIKHEQELDGKSTAIHSRVIANEDVDIHLWRNMPEFESPERTLLLFPGPDAKQLKDIPRDAFDRVAVIDGTWKQAKKIVRETPALQKFQKVTIAPRKTYFWRYQQLSENHLATIEAIYYFYKEYEEAYENSRGRYDNLLFFYRFFYNLIQEKYRSGTKEFCHRHRQGYIQYDASSDQKQQEDTKGSAKEEPKTSGESKSPE